MSWTYSDGTLSKSGLSSAEAREIAGMYRELYEDSRNELISYLAANLEDFPEYADSECNIAGPRTLVVRYENSIEKKHFGI
jgi:hypothetical protein